MHAYPVTYRTETVKLMIFFAYNMDHRNDKVQIIAISANP
jgi:hypothetical protein